MKQPIQKTARKRNISPLTVAVLLIGVMVVGFLLYVYLNSPFSPINRAAEIAAPLEAALVKAGGVKMCTSGDAGRGWDNTSPHFSALYEISGDKETAAKIVLDAAREQGFTLVDSSSEVNAEDNLHFADRTTVKSAYTDLSEGSVELLVTVYGSKSYTGDKLCTVAKRDTSGKTTFDFTIKLPAFKR